MHVAPPGFYRDPEGNGFRFWEGVSWRGRWVAPPGYYRPAPGSPIREWDRDKWRERYWTWWRAVAVAALVLVGGVVELVATAAGLSDPGAGGDTADFERTKGVGALVFLTWPLVVVALLVLLNYSLLRTRNAVSNEIRRASQSNA